MRVLAVFLLCILVLGAFCSGETTSQKRGSMTWTKVESTKGMEAPHIRQRRWGGYYGGFGGPIGWGWRRPFGLWHRPFGLWRRPFFGGWGMPFGGFGGYPMFWGR